MTKLPFPYLSPQGILPTRVLPPQYQPYESPCTLRRPQNKIKGRSGGGKRVKGMNNVIKEEERQREKLTLSRDGLPRRRIRVDIEKERTAAVERGRRLGKRSDDAEI